MNGWCSCFPRISILALLGWASTTNNTVMLLLSWMVYNPFNFNIRYRAISGFEEQLLGSPISHESIEILEEIGAIK